MPRQNHEFVIVRDRDEGMVFYEGRNYLSAGGWSVSDSRDDAHLFQSRDAAAIRLQEAGKHKEGWRVLRSDQV